MYSGMLNRHVLMTVTKAITVGVGNNMSLIQELLDTEAKLSNERYAVVKQIKAMRGNDPPVCWGHDDCSTLILMHCPWRVDCEAEGVKYVLSKR